MVTQNVHIAIQPKVVESAPQSRIRGRIITTKLVGVSFEDRQEVIARLETGDRVWLEMQMDNPFDRNAIMVSRSNGEQIGYLNRYLAKNIAPYFEAYGKPVRGKVSLLIGSSFDEYSLGVIIAFKIPRLSDSRRANQIRQFNDWDEE
ncbi:MAG: HIRAN domain-containing protein [Anaerolineaceae bacterium]